VRSMRLLYVDVEDREQGVVNFPIVPRREASMALVQLLPSLRA
jgi:hypothetical protein